MDEDEGQAFRSAGSGAIEVNAPMGDARRISLIGWLRDRAPQVAVDLGCGSGAVLVQLLAESPSTRGIGVDLDADSISRAERRAQMAGVADRVRFEVADAVTFAEPCDAVVAVGVGHVFGGAAAMLGHLAGLIDADGARGGVALVGAGVWSRRPDRWCRDTFGDLLRPDDLVDKAEVEGWTVEDVTMSTVEEWDAFEEGWDAGVESLGTPGATAFVAQRRDDYARYRGVLGFTWLQLSR